MNSNSMWAISSSFHNKRFSRRRSSSSSSSGLNKLFGRRRSSSSSSSGLNKLFGRRRSSSTSSSGLNKLFGRRRSSSTSSSNDLNNLFGRRPSSSSTSSSDFGTGPFSSIASSNAKFLDDEDDTLSFGCLNIHSYGPLSGSPLGPDWNKRKRRSSTILTLNQKEDRHHRKKCNCSPEHSINPFGLDKPKLKEHKIRQPKKHKRREAENFLHFDKMRHSPSAEPIVCLPSPVSFKPKKHKNFIL
ncbi:unnamed protein product [Adineta ricciae]|uniref:Uncharacterized protein n=1 Tax=Adineta ricciae TaxID=249248 RepID=A0A814KHB4_ADIRI|nr:unnamed protein product [Adineta ricciae]